MNVHLYTSSGSNESRLLKEFESIEMLGLSKSIIFLGIAAQGYSSLEKITDEVTIHRLPLISSGIKVRIFAKLFSLLEYQIRAFFWVFMRRATQLHCHSLMVLPVGVLLKIFGKTHRLIYDAHELETERAGLTGFSRRASKWLERVLIESVDHVIVVCEPIADWYRHAYGLENISVIRNIPKRKDTLVKADIFRVKFTIPEEHIIFIYQGIISDARGIRGILEVFSQAHADRHVVFMGFGSGVDLVKKFASKYANIHYQEAVEPTEIVSYTSSADIGIFFLTNDIAISLSYKYSLPNKFFEYLQAGCPVLVSDSLSHMTDIVNRNHLGWSKRSTIEDMLEFVNDIDKANIASKISATQKYMAQNCWEHDASALIEVFEAQPLSRSELGLAD